MRQTVSFQVIENRRGLKMAYVLGTLFYGLYALIGSLEAYYVALTIIPSPFWGALFCSSVTVMSFWSFVYYFVWKGAFLLPPVGKTIEQAKMELAI